MWSPRRLLRGGAVASTLWAVSAASGQTAEPLPDLSACQPLAACIRLLDPLVPAGDTGALPQGADAAAKQLSRFGESAKMALLDRARGPQPGWRNYAGAILSYWTTWSDQDVPALSTALELDPGGWIARPLMIIGSDRAIDALVADLPRGNGLNQTTWALAHLAPRSLMKLMPLLERGPRYPAGDVALDVIRDSGNRVRTVLPTWTSMATNKTLPPARRLAALRAIAAASGAAVEAGPVLRPLLADTTPGIADATRKALLSLGDRAAAAMAVRDCVPTDLRTSEDDGSSRAYCMFDLERFGTSPEIVGPRLLQFAKARDGEEAAWAMGVIAQLNYKAAGPTLIAKLNSSDWRVAYSAAAALGELGLRSGIPALEKVSREHWLPEVRRQAQQSLNAIRAGTPLRPRTRIELIDNPTIGRSTLAEATTCGAWRWRGQDIRPPTTILHAVKLGGGTLVAVDKGEWGGGLEWSPTLGTTQTLLKDNVGALEPIDGGVLALSGLAHLDSNYGYVTRARRTASGWDVQEIARLPSRFSSISTIGPDSYAAWSARRVVIFSGQGVLGLAECRR
jgi:hypothetical protein